MKAKRMNTNAIKGNKMATIAERKTFKVWKERVHVKITERKKEYISKEDGTKIFKRCCVGKICAKKKPADRNVVPKVGEECHRCYTQDLTGFLPKPTFFDSQTLTRFAL